MKITNEQEIRIVYDNFYISYNKTNDEWRAHHYDEDKYDEDYIIDIPFKEPIELFDGFILDIQEFKEVENIKNSIIP